MKLSKIISAEFKNTSNIPTLLVSTSQKGQMVAPGGSSCTLGCSCSCSCGATSKQQAKNPLS